MKGMLKNTNQKTFIAVLVSIAVICFAFVGIYKVSNPYSIAINQNADVVIDSKLDKYYNYNLSEKEKGSLVQYDVKTGIEYQEDSEYYPIKENQLNIQISAIDDKFPSAVKVITKSTEATNGNCEENKVTYNYEKSDGKLTIVTSNLDDDGNVIKNKKDSEVRDEYLIICDYDTYTSENTLRSLSLDVSEEADLQADVTTKITGEKNFDATVSENYGELTSISYDTSDIYNGYLKSNTINDTDYDTDYNDNLELLISKKDASDSKFEIAENNSFVQVNGDKKTDVANNGNVVYKTLTISKSNMDDILGKDGEIQILDENGEELVKVNKDTEFSENGTFTFEYPDGIENIVIKTSEVKNEGLLKINNVHSIKNTLKDYNNLSIKATTTFNDKTDERILEINDAKSDVSMKVSNSDWTNKEQNELVFTLDLNTDSEAKNLFNTPSFSIELPSEVEKVILGNATMNQGNGLDFKSVNVNKNSEGNYVITVNLSGTQTEYLKNELNLTTEIKIPATIILNKDIESTDSELNVNYTNMYSTTKSPETGKFEVPITLSDYKEETVVNDDTQDANKQEEKIVQNVQTTNVSSSAEQGKYVKLNVIPTVGDKTLTDNTVVYEGEYIKYNVSVTNISNETLDNVKAVATIPDGVTYGELNFDYDNADSEYKYDLDSTVKQKEINIGSIKAGETVTKYYEVQVNDLEDGETEKNITTNVKAYIGNNEDQNFEITNKVNKADYKIFMGAMQEYESGYWSYTIKVTSNEDKVVPVTITVPKEFKRSYLLDDKSDDDKTDDNTKYYKFDPSKDTDSTFTVDLNTNVTFFLGGSIDRDDLTTENADSKTELSALTSVTENNKTYYSNEARIVYEYKSVSVSVTSPNEGEEVTSGDDIDYQITIKNTGKTNGNDGLDKFVQVDLTDYLPEEVKPVSITYTPWEIEKNKVTVGEGEYQTEGIEYTGKYSKGEEKTESISNVIKDVNGNKKANVNLNLFIPYGESSVIDVKTQAGYVSEPTKIDNSATVVGTYVKTKTSNTISHTIVPVKAPTANTSSSTTTPNSSSKIANTTQPTTSTGNGDTTSTYSISGVAWIDANEDGKKQSSETVLSGVDVILVNNENGNYATDNAGNDLKATTDSNGNYKFSNVPTGNYVVLFKYDTSKYHVASNQADVAQRNLTFDGEQLTAGLTNAINLTANVTDTNIGLTENKVSDLRLDKYVSKVTVKTKSGTKTNTYNDSKLAKTEIRAKEVEGATVIVEYKIVVTNEGELPETVNKIVDYMPDGITFSSELNSTWAKSSDGSIINTSLSGKKIQPGEKAELTLIGTKTMTSTSTGTFTNIAEIAEASNSAKIADKDSTPNNKNPNEDDYSKAELILSISTGTAIYISIAIIAGVALIVAIIILHTNKKLVKISKVGKNGLFMLFIMAFMICGIFGQSIGEEKLISDEKIDEELYLPPEMFAQWNRKSGQAQNGDWVARFESDVGSFVCLAHNHPAHGAGKCPYCEAWGPYGYGLYDFIGAQGNTEVVEDTGIVDGVKPSVSITKTSADDDINVTAMNGKINNANVDGYLYGPFKMVTKNNCKAADSSLTVSVKDLNGNDVASQLCDANGNEITLSLDDGEKEFYIFLSSDTVANGLSQIKVDIKGTSTYTHEKSIEGEPKYTPDDPGYSNDICQPIGLKITRTMRVEKWQATESAEDSITWENLPGGLIITKTDSDNKDKKLAHVKFDITCDEIGFKQTVETGDDGKTPLIVGLKPNHTYTITETENPNYGYTEYIEPDKISFVSGQIITKQYENKRTIVKLSGYVWEDLLVEKQSLMNSLYNESGDRENGVNGIKVSLKDQDGNVVKNYYDKDMETTTSELGIYDEIEGGEYRFDDIKIDELKNYYIEFEYNGLIYQSVPSVDRRVDTSSDEYQFTKINASRATDRTEREALDAAFTSIDGNGTNTLKVSNYTINYNDTEKNASTYKDSDCLIHATTKDTQTEGYEADKELDISSLYHAGYTGDEMKYFNLGIYEKAQADMALGQDLESVNVTLNGYNHVYEYANRAKTFDSEDSGSWNVGVKFKREYKAGYKRAIYKSDLEYTSSDKSKELQVYLTYAIALRNQSSYTTKINGVVEYFDNNYELVSIGTSLKDNKNETSGDLTGTPESYDNQYKKVNIKTDITVEPNESQYIYIQFKLSRDNVLNILSTDGEGLYVTAEITSYTVLKDGKTVAAIDQDSVPGNAVLNKEETYEDDTEAAPAIKLEAKNERKITGSVFLDSTSGELQTGKVRQGDGIYNDGETAIPGVRVFMEYFDTTANNWVEGQVYDESKNDFVNSKDANIVTDENGNYEISGFVPGQYRLVFTWGDKTYKVQYYKGTIYDKTRYDKNNQDMSWYKNDVDTRYQDAIDDYSQRIEIDKQIANVKDSSIADKINKAYDGDTSTGITTTMDSKTPTMEFSVEYDTVITDGNDDKLEFITKNVDFGIVERARQQLNMSKKVKTFKVTLPNGQVLIDATVSDDGKTLSGEHNYTTIQAPTADFTGYVKGEMDSELIEGSTLEVVYEIKVTNNSESDYMSEDFYKFGTQTGNVVTISPSKIADYLDSKYTFNQQNGWTQGSASDIQSSSIDEDVRNGRAIAISNQLESKQLAPTESASVELTATKLLATSDDLTFDNSAEVLENTKPNGDSNHTGTPIVLNDVNLALVSWPHSSAQQVMIVPSTGGNQNYTLPIVIGIVALVVLGVGIFFIRKITLRRKQ